MTQPDLGWDPIRSAQGAHDVQADSHRAIGDLVRALDAWKRSTARRRRTRRCISLPTTTPLTSIPSSRNGSPSIRASTCTSRQPRLRCCSRVKCQI